ncbi:MULTISPECIES: thymidine kinase [Providencia]|uniref:thymidine kinase n=1 Tax=unclassified Providencia TaxID=2633465 RepID=UPI001E411354|nr:MULTISPECIES: thymidine kinase [Providencia]
MSWRIALLLIISWRKQSTGYATLFSPHTPQMTIAHECQFLTKKQVEELCDIVDNEDIPVLCYGLRTDFAGQLFEGSQYLLAWADKLVELKTVCYCGRKASKVLRIGSDGVPVYEGLQVDIGGNEKYISVCRKHYSEAIKQAQLMNEGVIPKKPLHFR